MLKDAQITIKFEQFIVRIFPVCKPETAIKLGTNQKHIDRQSRPEETPVIVENVLNRIDEVVSAVRFEGWKSTIRGDQEVRKALRSTLYLQFKIRDNDVFEKDLSMSGSTTDGHNNGMALLGMLCRETCSKKIHYLACAARSLAPAWWSCRHGARYCT